MIEKPLHLEGTEVFRMSLVAENNEASNPVPVGLLGSGTEVATPTNEDNLIKQAGRLGSRTP